MHTLFESPNHKNVLFGDLSTGSMVQANQHIIVHDGEAMVLDPGGHKVYTKLLGQISAIVPPKGLKHILFSHQDPDIIAAANGWLMVTDAKAYLSSLWMRFIPHFGVDELVLSRIHPVDDAGMTVQVGSAGIKLIPAHFLHSPGNFQVYDPVSRILYSGDLGASIGTEAVFVEDFDAHVPFMKGFHQRYMPSNVAFRRWAAMVRTLDIQTIAPQHGAIFRGPEMVGRFVDWIEELPCGLDLMEKTYQIPS